MGVTEWVLLIVVVILIPLAIAVIVTLWSLEQARQRTKRNRPGQVRRVTAPDRDAVGSDQSPVPDRVSDNTGRPDDAGDADETGPSSTGSSAD